MTDPIRFSQPVLNAVYAEQVARLAEAPPATRQAQLDAFGEVIERIKTPGSSPSERAADVILKTIGA